MNREKLKDIYKKYNLEEEDIFILKFGNSQKPIITRSGIEKIKNKLEAQITYKIENLSTDHKCCVILATGALFEGAATSGQAPRPKLMVQSFGEVSPANNTQKYPIAIAEKRAMGRVVLKLANLYGFYSEDEAEEFKK